jgi:hypothetical protein
MVGTPAKTGRMQKQGSQQQQAWKPSTAGTLLTSGMTAAAGNNGMRRTGQQQYRNQLHAAGTPATSGTVAEAGTSK